MIRRLSVSLRFDDDTDFYNDFIVEKRDSRELTTLILDLLSAYYEDETVRQLVNNFIDSQNPYMSISEQLQRIALEHTRRKVSTTMLGDYVSNEEKHVLNTEPKEKVSKNDNVSPNSANTLTLPEKGISVESLTPVITEVLKQLGIVGNANLQNNAPFVSQIAEIAKESVKSESISASIPASVPEPVMSSPVVTTPIISENVTVVEKPIIPVIGLEVDDIPKPPEKKAPKSFQKLLKSV